MNTIVFPREALQFDQLILHLATDQRVECGERLIHEEDVRLRGERAGEADALLHSAGECGGYL